MTLIACAVCFQLQSGAAIDGVRAAVITLVSITACVLVLVGRFAIRVARRQ
jgi:hypothetical protein